MFDDAELAERAIANFLEIRRALARAAPRGAIEEDASAVQIATGLPAPRFNPTLVRRPPADLDALAARLRHFYGRAGVAGVLIARDPAFDAALAPLVADLPALDPIRLMGVAPCAIEAATVPADLTIHRVADAATLRRYNDTFAAGFGIPRPVLAAFDDPALLALPDLAFYLGSVAGEPVATAALFCSHRIAGVYNVAVAPVARRRGLGAALTAHAVAEGRAAGCLATALQSTALAVPLYARLGYRPLGDLPTWQVG